MTHEMASLQADAPIGRKKGCEMGGGLPSRIFRRSLTLFCQPGREVLPVTRGGELSA